MLVQMVIGTDDKSYSVVFSSFSRQFDMKPIVLLNVAIFKHLFQAE